MNPLDRIDESWKSLVGSQLYQEPLKSLSENILPNIAYHPFKEDIFKVFEMPLNDIKVVILGQDPYPTPGDAVGRAFAIEEGRRIPASLRNIKQEVYSGGVITYDKLKPLDEWATLDHWTEQGVFLLNTALTVESGKAGSHLRYWEQFTKHIITQISLRQPCIWVLWGRKAQNFMPYIAKQFKVSGYDNNTIKEIPASPEWNYILTAPHPAAESYGGGTAGFYGCNHFRYINEILIRKHINPIMW